VIERKRLELHNGLLDNLVLVHGMMHTCTHLKKKFKTYQPALALA